MPEHDSLQARVAQQQVTFRNLFLWLTHSAQHASHVQHELDSNAVSDLSSVPSDYLTHIKLDTARYRDSTFDSLQGLAAQLQEKYNETRILVCEAANLVELVRQLSCQSGHGCLMRLLLSVILY